MAKYSKMQVLATMKETGMVPVFYDADAEVAKKGEEGEKHYLVASLSFAQDK